MSEDQQTLVDRFLHWFKGRRVGAVVVLTAMAVIGLGACAQAILHFCDLGERFISSLDEPPNGDPSAVALLLENFSDLGEGDDPEWGPNVSVKLREDGRKWLAATIEGAHSAGQDVSLPGDFSIEFDVSTQITGLLRHISDTRLEPISTEIRFIDDRGSPTKIACTFSGEGQSFTLPGGAKGAVSASGSAAGKDSVFPKGQTIQEVARRTASSLRIVRNGNVLKLFANDRLVASETMAETKKFVRFELDVVKRGEDVPLGGDDYSQRERYVSFTAFRVSEL